MAGSFRLVVFLEKNASRGKITENTKTIVAPLDFPEGNPPDSSPDPAAPEAAPVAAPAPPPPGPGRAGAIFEVCLCSGFPTQLAVAAGLVAARITPAGGGAGALSLEYVVALSLADTVLLVGLIGFLLRRHGERPSAVFLGGRPQLPELRLGLLLVPAIVVLATATLWLLHAAWPWLGNVPDNPIEALIRSPRDALILLVVAVVAGGVREELQRAFILRRFEQRLGGGWIGLVVFSAAFGLGHYVQGWDAAIVTGLLGALWGALFLLRRSVVAAMVSHAGFNAAEIAIALAAATPQH